MFAVDRKLPAAPAQSSPQLGGTQLLLLWPRRRSQGSGELCHVQSSELAETELELRCLTQLEQSAYLLSKYFSRSPTVVYLFGSVQLVLNVQTCLSSTELLSTLQSPVPPLRAFPGPPRHEPALSSLQHAVLLR